MGRGAEQASRAARIPASWARAAAEWDTLGAPPRRGVLPLARRPGRARARPGHRRRTAAPPRRPGRPRARPTRRGDRARPPDTLTLVSSEPEFRYSDLLPIGPDETPYRLVTTEGVSTFEAGRRGPSSQVDPGGDPAADRRGDARHRALPAARPPRPAAPDHRRPGGVGATTGSSRSTCSRTSTSPPAACCRCARTPAPRS